MSISAEYQSNYFNCDCCECESGEIIYLIISKEGSRCPKCEIKKEFPTIENEEIPTCLCNGCGSRKIIMDDGAYFFECTNCHGRWSRRSITHDMQPGEDMTARHVSFAGEVLEESTSQSQSSVSKRYKCNDCKFLNDNWVMPCAVNPGIACTPEADDCSDFEVNLHSSI